MSEIKVLEVLGDNKYVVEIEPIDTNTYPTTFGVAHDYVLFSSWSYLYADKAIFKHNTGGASNIIPVPVKIQIPIKVMGDVILPVLNDSEYLKEDHYGRYGVYSDKIVQEWADGEYVYVYDKTARKYEKISRFIYNKLTGKSDE